jgi:hypothetical protein
VATQEVVHEELVKAFVAYPQAQRSPDELPVVLALWIEGCEDLEDQMLARAMAAHRKVSKFFPTVAEIIEQAQGIEREDRRARAANIKALAQPTERTPEQIAHFQTKCRELQDRLSGRKLVLLPGERRTPRSVTERDRMEA